MDEISLIEMIAPLDGGTAVGHDLRSAGSGSELYLSAKDDRTSARSAEREALAAGDPDLDPLTAGLRLWVQVQEKGGTLLAHHAKDLQVAAWVVEAWVRTDGFAGLADGLTLLAELVEQYWDEGLYPQEDEDGIETRLAPLFGLFGRDEAGALLQPIKLLPLSDRGDGHVALWAIEAVRAQAVRHDDPEVREELTARREQRIAEFEAQIAAASSPFVDAAVDAIDRSLVELDRLMAALEIRTAYGRFGSQITAPLTAIGEILGRHRSPAAMAADTIEAGPAETDPQPGAEAAPPKQKALDRPTALATLAEIAGFFDRTEPQSLVGNSLRDLVRRANLPVDELMAELLPDREQRAMFLLRAGIAPPRTSNSSDTF